MTGWIDRLSRSRPSPWRLFLKYPLRKAAVSALKEHLVWEEVKRKKPFLHGPGGLADWHEVKLPFLNQLGAEHVPAFFAERRRI
jgi:hypothetical protein